MGVALLAKRARLQIAGCVEELIGVRRTAIALYVVVQHGRLRPRLDDFAHSVEVDLGVVGGRLRGAVPQDGADAGQGYPVAQHGGGGRMAQQMRAVVGRLDPCTAKSAGHDTGHGASSRCQSRDKDLWRQRRAPAAQIGDDAVADLPAASVGADPCRRPRCARSASRWHRRSARRPRSRAGPGGRAEDYRPVSGPNCILIAAHADRLRLKELRCGGELVARETRHRVDQALRALPGGGEEPQESACCRSDQLRRGHLVAGRPRYHEAAHRRAL